MSSSFEGWHRASAGLPAHFAARVSGHVRVPLFSCMVAYTAPLGLPLDGLTFHGGDALGFAARSASKPGFPSGAPAGGEEAAECWSLVSTPGYACREIASTPMQDADGSFLPQSDGYLNSLPGPALLAAFAEAVAPMLEAAGRTMPSVAYSQAQRWGSAMPSAPSWEGAPVELMGVTYQAAIPPLMRPRPPGDEADFVAADEQRLYYAGDFCSRRAPGFEAAALSAADAAAHVVRELGSD